MARSQSAAADTDPPTPVADGGAAASPAISAAPVHLTAPDHVTAITLSTEREIRVENGMLPLPDDLTDDERRQIERAGFIAA